MSRHERLRSFSLTKNSHHYRKSHRERMHHDPTMSPSGFEMY
jgi:hypothetical protein